MAQRSLHGVLVAVLARQALAAVLGNYTIAGFVSLQDAQNFASPATVAALSQGLCRRYLIDAARCQTKLGPPQVNDSISIVARYSVSVQFPDTVYAGTKSVSHVQSDLARLPTWAMTALVITSLQNSNLLWSSIYVAFASMPVLGPPLASSVTTTVGSDSWQWATASMTVPSTAVTTIEGNFSLYLYGSMASWKANCIASDGGRTATVNVLSRKVDPFKVLANTFSVSVSIQRTSRRLGGKWRALQFEGYEPDAMVAVSFVIRFPLWAYSYNIARKSLSYVFDTGYYHTMQEAGSLMPGPCYLSNFAVAPGATQPQVYMNGGPTTSTGSSTTSTTTVSMSTTAFTTTTQTKVSLTTSASTSTRTTGVRMTTTVSTSTATASTSTTISPGLVESSTTSGASNATSVVPTETSSVSQGSLSGIVATTELVTSAPTAGVVTAATSIREPQVFLYDWIPTVGPSAFTKTSGTWTTATQTQTSTQAAASMVIGIVSSAPTKAVWAVIPVVAAAASSFATP